MLCKVCPILLGKAPKGLLAIRRRYLSGLWLSFPEWIHTGREQRNSWVETTGSVHCRCTTGVSASVCFTELCQHPALPVGSSSVSKEQCSHPVNNFFFSFPQQAKGSPPIFLHVYKTTSVGNISGCLCQQIISNHTSKTPLQRRQVWDRTQSILNYLGVLGQNGRKK